MVYWREPRYRWGRFCADFEQPFWPKLLRIPSFCELGTFSERFQKWCKCKIEVQQLADSYATPFTCRLSNGRIVPGKTEPGCQLAGQLVWCGYQQSSRKNHLSFFMDSSEVSQSFPMKVSYGLKSFQENFRNWMLCMRCFSVCIWAAFLVRSAHGSSQPSQRIFISVFLHFGFSFHDLIFSPFFVSYALCWIVRKSICCLTFYYKFTIFVVFLSQDSMASITRLTICAMRVVFS